ncbi:MAG: hypothetical protein OEY49_10365, partial [Candidatus Heimdallarchaeota archaeon]|nr:hypothetical protein [Candidatus Heimdallarchaeota archaeon]
MNLNSIKYKKGVAIFIFLLLIQTVNAQTTSYKYVSDETQFDFVITGVSGTYFDFLSVDDDVTLRYEESLKGKVSEDILEVRVSYSLNGDGVNDEVEWAKLTLVMALWAVAPVDGGGT